MSNILIPGQGIIFMKVGVHAQEDLTSIIKRKTQEIDEAGFALWGYGGTTCFPTSMVQPFAKEHEEAGKKIYLCMQEMNSKHHADPVRADQYSIDGQNWRDIPQAINVLGSRFALAIKDLKATEFNLPIEKSVVGTGTKIGVKATDYIRGQADKACLILGEDINIPPAPTEKLIPINLIAELCEPYSVFLRNYP